MVEGNTPDGFLIDPQWVDRCGGRSLRIMIIHPKTGKIHYGYALNTGETKEDAVQKWKDGTYKYHLP